MLDTVVNCQLGRACCFLETSTLHQLEDGDGWTSGRQAVYADDFIAGFQYKADAERYYAMLKERLRKFNLELEESKSRLIEFGRYAESNRKRKEGRTCRN
jgi:hypothetical protein